jgi:O-antigen ligase/tetratricopeptide (TPR) repeat protein
MKPQTTASQRLFIFTSIILASFFFSPYSISPFRESREAILYAVLSFALIFVLFKKSENETGFIKNNPILLPFIAFLIISLLSTAWGRDPYSTSRTSINIFYGLCIFKMTAAQQWNKRSLEKILFLIVICGFCNSIYGLMQYFDIDPIFQKKIDILSTDPVFERSKITGFMGNPNLLSDFLALCLPAALILLLTRKKLFWQIIILILSSVMVTSIFLAQTRSSFFAVIIGLVFFFTMIFFMKKDAMKVKKKNIVTLLVLLIIIMELLYLLPGLKDRIKFESETLKLRKAIWRTTLEMIVIKPWLGFGAGSFKHEFYDHHIERLLREHRQFNYTPSKNGVDQAHNEYLQIIAESGLVGLFIILWLLAAYIKSILRFIESNEDEFYHIQQIGAATSIIILVLSCIASFPLHFISTAILPLIYMGMSRYIPTNAENNRIAESKEHCIFEFIKKPMIFIGSLTLLLVSVMLSLSQYYSKAGDVEFGWNKIDGASGFYNKAVKLNPGDGEMNFRYGSCLIMNKDYKKALFYLTRSKKNLQRPETDVKIGYCYEMLGDMEKSVYYYENSVIYSDNFDDIKIKLGDYFFNKAEKEKKLSNLMGALSLYKKSIIYQPNQIDVYIEIAKLYQYLGDENKQLYYLETALGYNQKNEKILIELADIYFDKKDYVTASKYYSILTSMNLEDERYNKYILEKYISMINEFKKDNPEDPFWDFQLYVLFDELKDETNANKFLEYSITRNIDIGYPYFIFGKKFYESGDMVKAVNLLEQSIKIDSSIIDAYYLLIQIYRKKGDSGKANQLELATMNITPQCGYSKFIPRKTKVKGSDSIKVEDERMIEYLGSSYVAEYLYIEDRLPTFNFFKKVHKSSKDEPNLKLISEKNGAKFYSIGDRFIVSKWSDNKIGKLAFKYRKNFAKENFVGKIFDLQSRINKNLSRPLIGRNWIVVTNSPYIQTTDIISDTIYTDPSKYYLFGYDIIGIENGLASAKISWFKSKSYGVFSLNEFSYVTSFDGKNKKGKCCILGDCSNANICELIFNCSKTSSADIFHNVLFIEVDVNDQFFEDD